jgi:Zn-dependent peptidase ImmA (M78 family)/transcriptional regulator with XRE-family HTH domain
MGPRLQVDPVRLRSLRTRLGIPLDAAAKRVNVSETALAKWESESAKLSVETLQKLARSYKRNWYVFLLEEEDGFGKPAIPHDFRRRRGAAASLGSDSLIAIDEAWLRLDKIEAVNDGQAAQPVPQVLRATKDSDPEEIAARFRKKLGVSMTFPAPVTDAYAALRAWIEALTAVGIYISQVRMPTEEIRAFCLSRRSAHLIVLSNKDWPTARIFSLIHEVGHLLLGSDAMCQPIEAGSVRANHWEEPWCNHFAAAVLMPRAGLDANPRFHELLAGEIEVGMGRALANEIGVSELALFRRLETFGHISTAQYQALQDEADRSWDARAAREGDGFLVHSRRIVSKESPLLVRHVFDSYERGDLSYREVGMLLDAPLRSIPKIREATR